MAYDRFAAIDENELFPPSVREALASSAELRSLIIPMTQVQRNNLSGGNLWDGRVVANTTTDRLNRYDAGTDTWKVLVEEADLTTINTALDSRLDVVEAAVVSLDSRLDADEAYTEARVLNTSAGLQQNVNGRWYLDTGFPAPRVSPPLFSFARDISGTMEMENYRADAYETSNGVVYVVGGTLSLGLPVRVTRID